MLLVIYINITTKGRFSLKNFDAKLEEIGDRGVFFFEEKIKRGRWVKRVWKHNRYQGRIEFGEVPEQKLIYVSVWGNEEERLTSSFIEWIIRYFPKKFTTIEIFPEAARTGKE